MRSRWKRLRANKAALPMVPERPETPLHANGSASRIRCHVTRNRVIRLFLDNAGIATPGGHRLGHARRAQAWLARRTAASS